MLDLSKLNVFFSVQDLPHLLIILGVVTIFLLVYMLVVKQSGSYPTARQFWKMLLISLAVSYLLSSILFFLLHINYIFTMMIVLLIAFIIQGDIGIQTKDTSPTNAEENPPLPAEES